MTTFTNHVALALPRNATTTHTVDPNGGTVVTGTNFVPTAGSFLLCVTDAATTTSTPTDWTLPTNGSAINYTGLYIFYRTAAGSDTFDLVHGESDYPAVADIYEFAAGSTFVSAVTATSVAYTAANPNLTGLTGTNFVMAAKAEGGSSTGFSASTVWNLSTTESLDAYVIRGGTGPTDGWYLGVCYFEDYASASFQPTGNHTSFSSVTCECLTWAVVAASGETPQVIRPDGDVTRVDWVDEGAGTTDLWDGLDETSPSDADYITVSV